MYRGTYPMKIRQNYYTSDKVQTLFLLHVCTHTHTHTHTHTLTHCQPTFVSLSLTMNCPF